MIIILDNCFSDNAIKATPLAKQTVELFAAVGADQRVFDNPSDLTRNLNCIFIRKLVEKVAFRKRKEEKSLVLLDIITNLQSYSNAE